jgi:hypothetical protein
MRLTEEDYVETLFENRRNKMKTKKFSKKLVLNKKTVANLENGEMKKVQGGKTVVSCPCPRTEFCPTWIFAICSPC